MTGYDALALRRDLLPFAAGVLLLTVGLVAIAAGLLRRGSRATVLNFGGACALYGLRLAARTEPAHLLIDGTPIAWSRLDHGVTYLIGVPAALFWAEFMGRRWRSVFRWVAVANASYAAVGIAVEVAGAGTAVGPYLFLVLVNQVLGVWAVMRPDLPASRELRIVRTAYLILVFFILNENIDRLGLPSVPRIEWVGFTLFLLGLAWATALQVFEGERRLADMNREMETARRIQASILPRTLPRIPGVSLAARYHPMNAVAGDLYDVVARGSSLGVFVADVSGHGVPAALVASMVKLAFAAQGPHAEEPSRVLAGVNRALCGVLEGAFVTAAYAWLDLRSFRLSYAAAGHPPLLLRRRGGVELLAENGMMMGVMADAEYPVTSRPLAPGDRLVLYTDGVIEAFAPGGEEFEVQRLTALLEASRDEADRFADALLARLAAWRGGRNASDDLTLVVVDIERGTAA